MFRITPVVRNLLIVNVVFYLAQQFLSVTGILLLWPLDSENFYPYQFITYMFAHGGLGHIFFNMFALVSFAPILENYWGDKKFLIFYLATGIGAGIIYGVVNYFTPGLDGPMLGASGAIYGILMAFGMVFPNMEVMLLIPPIPIKAKYLVILIGVLTYFMDSSGTVAHLAHFGGAFIAFILITFWRSQGQNKGW